tara:strand:+ start:116 stop:301 length:186 start_codon:yes stop_codon:yes gene_type:complete
MGQTNQAGGSLMENQTPARDKDTNPDEHVQLTFAFMEGRPDNQVPDAEEGRQSDGTDGNPD